MVRAVVVRIQTHDMLKVSHGQPEAQVHPRNIQPGVDERLRRANVAGFVVSQAWATVAVQQNTQTRYPRMCEHGPEARRSSHPPCPTWMRHVRGWRRNYPVWNSTAGRS